MKVILRKEKIVSNDKEVNVYERLWIMIGKMIMDGVRDPHKVADALQGVLQGVVDAGKVFLRRLYEAETITLPATTGKDTNATAKKVFPAGFDADFENWGIVFSGVAPTTDIVFDELVADGQFSDFFGNTAVEIEKRRFLGAQFLEICRVHSDKFRKEGYANFVVLTKGDEPVAEDLSNVFVARVDVDDQGELGAYVFKFGNDVVWSGGLGRRIVSPQQ